MNLTECISGTFLFRFIICRGSTAVGLSSIVESETGVAAERSAFLGVLSSWSSNLIRAPGLTVKFGKVWLLGRLKLLSQEDRRGCKASTGESDRQFVQCKAGEVALIMDSDIGVIDRPI